MMITHRERLSDTGTCREETGKEAILSAWYDEYGTDILRYCFMFLMISRICFSLGVLPMLLNIARIIFSLTGGFSLSCFWKM